MSEFFVAQGVVGYLVLLNTAVVAVVIGTFLHRRQADGWRSAYVGSDVLGGDEERLHAVRSSLAGVAAAVEVLTVDEASAGVDSLRPRVELMLRQEVGRLQRLMDPEYSAKTREETCELRVDDLLESVTLARQLTGQEVSWHPSGHRVVGRRDEVLEVLNVLFTNAARHAAGTPATVRVASHAGFVRMTVSDSGPGVSRQLRGRLFERGARGESSVGEGLGLHVASALAQDMGGTLALERRSGHGAAFTVSLPAARVAEEAMA